MARPKGSKNKSKTPPSAPSLEDSNGIGHNSEHELDADSIRQALALQHLKIYEARLEEKKAAAADFLACCRAIKAELGKNGVKLIKDMILISSPEGEEELAERAARARQAARYMAAELGTQFPLFDDAEAELDLEASSPADRAYNEGKRDGAAGDPLSPDYPAGSEEFASYSTGWQNGAAALRAGRNGPLLAESEEERAALAEIAEHGIGPAVAAEAGR